MWQDSNKMILISVVIGIVIMAMLNIYGMGIINKEMSNKVGGQAVVDLVPSNAKSKVSGYVIFSENMKDKTTLIKMNVKGLSKNSKWKIDGIKESSLVSDIVSKGGIEKVDEMLVSGNNSVIGRTLSISVSSGKEVARGVIGYMNTENK